MKIEIENLKALVHLWNLNVYQKALAISEFNKLLDYVNELEQATKDNSIINCPFCSNEMKGIKLTHYKCKKCNEYFTD
jgi:transposase-like protein